MRMLNRNKRLIWYAPLIGEERVVDSDGNITSEKRLVYGEPHAARVNVSSERGEYVTALFGDIMEYDLVIVCSELALPIDESAAIWVRASPDAASDYRVVRISESLNGKTILIRRVRDR